MVRSRGHSQRYISGVYHILPIESMFHVVKVTHSLGISPHWENLGKAGGDGEVMVLAMLCVYSDLHNADADYRCSS